MPEERKATMSVPHPIEREERDRQTTGARSDEEHRATVIGRVILIGIVVVVSLIGLYIPYYLQMKIWQIPVDVGGLVMGLVCLALARWSLRRGKLDTAGYWILLTVVISYSTGELVWANETLYNIIGGVLLIFLVGSIVLPGKWGAWLVTAGLYVTYVFLVNQFEPLPRYDAITETAELLFFDLGLGILVALAVLWQIARTFRIGNIRTRLLIAFVTMVLLPAVVIGVAAGTVGVQGVQQRLIGQIELVAMFKEAEVNVWISSLQTDLDDVLDVGTALLSSIVLQEPDTPFYDMHDHLQKRFQRHIGQTKLLEELLLLDLQGQAVLSTDAAQEGTIHSDQTYFQEGLKGACVQPLFYSPSLDRRSVVVVRPVVDQQGQVSGVLVGRASTVRLNEILGERTGLGETGKAYLVDLNHTLLTESHFGEEGTYVRTQGTDAAIEDHTNGSAMYKDYRGERVIGVYHWLPELQVALLAEQDQSEALGGVYLMLGAAGGGAIVAVLIAMAASLFVARSIGDPLADLAETATQIADGDLERAAKVEREDEIGTLAQAFNSMTAQLRDLIGGLERRVAERTRELERRSVYQDASAEVSRAASSILDADRLVRQVVELIHGHFGLYYVGLFLLGEAGEWAVLRAGTGEAGRAMLARGHRIKVGEGMIGWSIANAQARVALDVGEDAVRLATAELPDTRSEAALPLRSRGEAIGALTVQSDQPAAFDEVAIAVLETMADQVAVALDNARLFTEAQSVLRAARSAYSELSREAWAELLHAQLDLSYRSDERGVTGAGDTWRPEMARALQEGKTIQGDGAGTEDRRPLAVPIKVRGNVIGVLDTYKSGAADEWTPEEVVLLGTLADQLGRALESARLYQDTQRRAARERLTREITDKMRRATGVEGIVQAALDELFGVLGTSRAFVRLETAPPAQDDGKDEA